MSSTRPYHHGALPRAVLDAAVTAIAESGPSAVSLRDLARRAGVSHAAPAHHFGDKAGLLTVLAAEGFELLADALTTAQRATGDFVEVGVAYVRFAKEHRAHFAVMFRPDLYDAQDPAVRAAEARAGASLHVGVESVPVSRTGPDRTLAGVAAWSLMHGFATLWIDRALPATLGDDPEEVGRAVATLLFGTDRS